MPNADALIVNVLAKIGQRVPAAKLVKLVYLVDYIHFQHFGETVTGFEYQWDHYGPNAVGHGIVDAAERLAREEQVGSTLSPNAFGGTTKYFSLNPVSSLPTLTAKVEMVLNDVIHRYGRLSVKKITAETKKTGPFKKISHYDTLTMEYSIPSMSATAEDSLAYHRDLRENGTIPLEELKRAYGFQ